MEIFPSAPIRYPSTTSRAGSTPASKKVTIQSGKTAKATGAYVRKVQQVGSLKVTITPQSAITVGARWQVDGWSPQTSGATVHNLSVGSHTVTFSNITGWNTPDSQTVTIQNGKTATATGAYLQQTGSLTVTITPQDAITAGAQWNVDGGSWQNSGPRSVFRSVLIL